MTKMKLALSAAGALAYALTLPAGSFAADTRSTGEGTSDMRSYGSEERQWGDLASLDKLEGMKVQDPNGDNVGNISDVVFEPSSGDIRYLVIESGGLLGFGEKEYAVPFHAFQFRADEDYLTFTMEKDRLRNAPEARSDLAYDADFAARVDQYYGVAPATGAAAPSSATASTTHGQATREKTHHEKTAAAAGEHGAFSSSEHLKEVKVTDSNGEDVGKIADVVFDISSGRIGYFVLSSGGAIGVGEKKYAIPFQAFQWGTDRNVVALNVDKEKLRNAPEARSDMAYDRDFTTQVDEYFGVSPSWGRDSETMHKEMHKRKDMEHGSREMHKETYKEKDRD
jgi:sporulation protein YlmC with PRC-barrel domain